MERKHDAGLQMQVAGLGMMVLIGTFTMGPLIMMGIIKLFKTAGDPRAPTEK